MPLATWKLVLACNGVDRSRYRSEHFDCNNFAVGLAGDIAQGWGVNGIVIDTSVSHAYNCVLTYDDGEVGLQMIEPQTDGRRLFTPSSCRLSTLLLFVRAPIV